MLTGVLGARTLRTLDPLRGTPRCRNGASVSTTWLYPRTPTARVPTGGARTAPSVRQESPSVPARRSSAHARDLPRRRVFDAAWVHDRSVASAPTWRVSSRALATVRTRPFFLSPAVPFPRTTTVRRRRARGIGLGSDRRIAGTERSDEKLVFGANALVDQRGASVAGQEAGSRVQRGGPDQCVMDAAADESRGDRFLDEDRCARGGSTIGTRANLSARKSATRRAGARCGGGRRVRTEYVSSRTLAGIRGFRARSATAVRCPSCHEAKAATTTLVSTAITVAYVPACHGRSRPSAAEAPRRVRRRCRPTAGP